MTCFECALSDMVPARLRVTGTRDGESFTVELMGLKCQRCGFETIDSDHSAELTRLISDEYRKAHSLLTSREIRSRRAHMGMTQQEFADYLGTGIASVKRWEAGQIQERAMDQLIRLKTDAAFARRNLDNVRGRVPDAIVLSAFPGGELTLVCGEQSWSESGRDISLASWQEQESDGEAYVVAA